MFIHACFVLLFQCSTAALPLEILTEILSYLCVTDILINVKFVNKRWHKLVLSKSLWSRMRWMDLLNTELCEADLTQIATNTVNVTVLDVHEEQIGLISCLKNVTKLQNLTVLSNYSGIHGVTESNIVTHISMCSGLVRLDIRGLSQITVNGLNRIGSSLPNLRSLNASRVCSVTPDELVDVLNSFSSIREIVLDVHGDKQVLATVLNAFCGKVCFGHSMVDSVPRRLLHCHRTAYSLANIF
jgi:hypothetical protein